MRLFGITSAIWFSISSLAHAADVVVVELFTSQGCSSCPPADQILGQLADREDVIALAYHVDYWDYLGWKDAFADPAHTVRQRAYARAAGERTIYTPQMVVGGQTHAVGSRAMQVNQAVMKEVRRDLPVAVELVRDGDSVVVRARTTTALPAMVVQLVTFEPKTVVKIKRGENRGRTLTYHNVVLSHSVLGEWNGQGTYSASGTVASDTPFAVLVQVADGGPIMGAAQLR